MCILILCSVHNTRFCDKTITPVTRACLVCLAKCAATPIMLFAVLPYTGAKSRRHNAGDRNLPGSVMPQKYG